MPLSLRFYTIPAYLVSKLSSFFPLSLCVLFLPGSVRAFARASLHPPNPLLTRPLTPVFPSLLPSSIFTVLSFLPAPCPLSSPFSSLSRYLLHPNTGEKVLKNSLPSGLLLGVSFSKVN